VDCLLDFFLSPWVNNLPSCISQFSIVFLLFYLGQHPPVTVNSWLFSVFLVFLLLFLIRQFFNTFDFLWWWWQIGHLTLLVANVKHISIFESKLLNRIGISTVDWLFLGLVFEQLEVFWISHTQSLC